MLLRQFTEHSPPHSILLSCALNSGLAVSTESTRVLIWQPLVMFNRGIYLPQPTQNPPPKATKNSPGEKCYYEKEWLLSDSHCFIKKIFFFFKQMFSRRIQRFSKVTAKTEQLIILFLKGLSLHRRFLYLKMLEMLRFTILLHCIWPLGWEEVGSGCIKRSQQDRAHQVLRRKAASLQASPGHRPWTYQSSPGLVAIVMNVLAISDQDWGNLIIRVIFRNAYYSSGQCYHKVSLKSWLRWCCASGGIKSVSDLNRIDQYYRKLTCIYGRPSTSLV